MFSRVLLLLGELGGCYALIILGGGGGGGRGFYSGHITAQRHSPHSVLELVRAGMPVSTM